MIDFSFQGKVIRINQTPTSGVQTGWRIWNAAYVILRYLELVDTDELRGKRILDLSAGTGIVGIALACCGCNVTCTEIGNMFKSSYVLIA